MCDNGFNSLGSPNIFHGLRYRAWIHEVWESYTRDGLSRRPRCYTLSRERRRAASGVLQVRKEGRASTESYRVLKVLYERHIEGKHVPFQLYVITPEEREEIENVKQLPSYSRAFAQDARRSKCIAMLNNIRNPRSSCLF